MALPPEDGYDKPTRFLVKITFHKVINLQVLKDYIISGNEPEGSDDVQTCISALNAYLNYKVRTSFLSVGRGIYPSSTERFILNTGEELRKGFCQSLRIGWGKLSYKFNVIILAYELFTLRLIHCLNNVYRRSSRECRHMF